MTDPPRRGATSPPPGAAVPAAGPLPAALRPPSAAPPPPTLATWDVALAECIPLLAETASAARLLAVHRRVSADTGLDGLERTAATLRDLCDALLSRLESVAGPRPATTAGVQAVVDAWGADLDGACLSLPVEAAAALARAAGTAGVGRGRRWGHLAQVADTVRALRTLAERAVLPSSAREEPGPSSVA